MQLSAPLYILKRNARRLMREQGLALPIGAMRVRVLALRGIAVHAPRGAAGRGSSGDSRLVRESCSLKLLLLEACGVRARLL